MTRVNCAFEDYNYLEHAKRGISWDRRVHQQAAPEDDHESVKYMISVNKHNFLGKGTK